MKIERHSVCGWRREPTKVPKARNIWRTRIQQHTRKWGTNPVIPLADTWPEGRACRLGYVAWRAVAPREAAYRCSPESPRCRPMGPSMGRCVGLGFGFHGAAQGPRRGFWRGLPAPPRPAGPTTRLCAPQIGFGSDLPEPLGGPPGPA